MRGNSGIGFFIVIGALALGIAGATVGVVWSFKKDAHVSKEREIEARKAAQKYSLTYAENVKSTEVLENAFDGQSVTVYGYEHETYYFPCYGILFIKALAKFRDKHPELELVAVKEGDPLYSHMSGIIGSDGPIVFFRKRPRIIEMLATQPQERSPPP